MTKAGVILFLTLCLASEFVNAQRIFWSESWNGRIRVGTLGQSSITAPSDFVTGLSDPRTVEVDQINNRLYYSNFGSEDIRTSNLTTGAFIADVITTGAMAGFPDFVYSENGGGIYATGSEEVEGLWYIPWNNNDTGNQFPLNLGSHTDDIFSSVVVDDGNEYVYVAGSYDNTIYRTGLSGGTMTPMVTLSSIQDIAYDRFNNHLYIVNYGTQYELYRFDLDGGGQTLLFTLGTQDIQCVQVYPQVGKVYFSRYNAGIFSVNMDGTGPPVTEIALSGVGDIFFDIAEDLTPPVLLTLNPANNAIDVLTTTSLVMTFDENIKVSTTGAPANELSIRIMRVSDNAVHQTIDRSSGNISIVNNTLTISGISGLEPNTEYYVLVGNRVVSDFPGNNFVGIASNAAWRFRTVPGVMLAPPTEAVCENSYVTLPDIAITEAHDSNIKAGSLVTVIFSFSQAGYEFNPGAGTSGHIMGRSITASMLSVSASQATLRFTAAPGFYPDDAITISGLQVRSTNGTNPPADIIRSGGTATIDGLVNGTVIASVTSLPAPAAPALSYPQGDVFCIGSDVSGTIVNVTGTAPKWYSDVDLTTEITVLAGASSATGTQLGVSSASAQVFNAYVVQTSGNCPSPAVTATVTIDPGPQSIETSTTDQTSCTAAVNGEAQVVDVNNEGLANYVVNWFDDSMNPIGSPGPALTGIAAGTYNAEVQSLITGCTNLAPVTVDDGRIIPAITTGSTENTHCATSNGTATANIQNPVGPASEYTFTWYQGPDSGSPMISTDQTATGLDAGTYSVIVEHAATGCASAITTIVVDDGTTQPVFAVPSGEVCETVFGSGIATIDLTTLNTQITGGDPNLTVTWLDALSNPITSADIAAGTIIEFRVQSALTGCDASGFVTFTVFTQPTPADAGADQTICGASVALSANMPIYGIGNWTITSGPPGAGFSDPSAHDAVFTGIAGNTYELQWTTYHVAQCPESVSTVTITLDAPPTTANAGPPQTLCEGPVTLAANTPTVGVGAWTVVSGTGGSFSDAALPNATFNGTAGTYTLRWTITNGNCTSSESEVDITLTSAPTDAVAGDDIISCATQVTLAANTPSVGNGAWSVVSGSGGVFGDPASPTSPFTGVTGTTYTLRWTTTNGACTPSEDDLTIVFNSAPSTASAGFDVELCGNSTTLAGNVPSSGIGTWSVVSGSGGSFGDAGAANSTFTGIAGSTYTLRWTISAGPDCPASEDDVTIEFVAPPTTAAAGDDATFCAESVNLSGNAPTTGTGEWTVVSGAGGSFSSASSATATFNGTVNTTYELRWTISNGVCPPSSDEVTITLIDPPTTAQAGADQSICGNSVALNANTPMSGTGTWSVVSGMGGAFSSSSSANTAFTGVPGTTYTLRWSIDRTGCAASTDDVIVDLKGVPQGTGILSALPPICEGTEATITLTGVSNATSFNWAVPAGVTILFQSDASVRIRATSGPGGAVSATPSNECGAGSQTNGNITVIPAPSLAIDLPASPFTDVPVQFTFSSSATIANASWNFGDGGTANGLVVEHAYSESGSYNITLTATADNGCENSASSPFVVLDEPELGDLSIKNVITANGDESNAYLYIVNIDRYPDNEVRFLDRWGVEVFSAKGYNNDWDARSKHGDFLPAGQYICIVKLNSTGKVFSRTVSIIKSR